MKKKVFVQSTTTKQYFPKTKKVINQDTPVIKKSCCGNANLKKK